MAIYKRGKVYWYKFTWNGKAIRESTKQGNDKVARQMEAAHRTSLAKGEVGIRDKKLAPTLAEFGEKRFAAWAKSATCEKTWLDYYRPGLRVISKYKPIASLRLNEITSERVSDFATWRRSQGRQVSSVNSALQVLRRILHLAAEWGVIEKVPNIRLLPGERRRERVVGQEEEARYLTAAPEPLASIATVLADTGMRPDECHRLCWEAITWVNGRNGTLLVTHGKTVAARRVLPMTPRVRALLQTRWERTGRPSDGWVWPASTRSGHVDRSSLKGSTRRLYASRECVRLYSTVCATLF
jgi:integrase